MVSGKAIKAYIQLSTLAEVIEDKGKEGWRQRLKTPRCEDNLMKLIEELPFMSDVNSINLSHSNLIS